MFTILKIKYLCKQPVATVNSKQIDKLIRRDYDSKYQEVKDKLSAIKSDSIKGKNRLAAAVLRLANGDYAKIDLYIEMCNYDFRDVISKAEYPGRSKLGFDKISSDKLKKIYLDDWTDYANWLNQK